MPTIHVLDLCRCVRRIVKEKIEKQYIFAVDRTRGPRVKNIIQALA
jgi:hypothetical protein